MNSLKTACLITLSFLLSTGCYASITIVGNLICEPASSTANVKVYFIDVGQGDAIFVDTDAMDVLIDGGPPGCNIISYLNSLNVTRIDLERNPRLALLEPALLFQRRKREVLLEDQNFRDPQQQQLTCIAP